MQSNQVCLSCGVCERRTRGRGASVSLVFASQESYPWKNRCSKIPPPSVIRHGHLGVAISRTVQAGATRVRGEHTKVSRANAEVLG